MEPAATSRWPAAGSKAESQTERLGSGTRANLFRFVGAHLDDLAMPVDLNLVLPRLHPDRDLAAALLALLWHYDDAEPRYQPQHRLLRFTEQRRLAALLRSQLHGVFVLGHGL